PVSEGRQRPGHQQHREHERSREQPVPDGHRHEPRPDQRRLPEAPDQPTEDALHRDAQQPGVGEDKAHLAGLVGPPVQVSRRSRKRASPPTNPAKAITKQKYWKRSRPRAGRRKNCTSSAHARSESRRPSAPDCTGRCPGRRTAVARMLRADNPAEARIGTASPNPASAPEIAGPRRKPIPKLMPISPKPRVRSFGSVTSAMYAWASTRFPAVSPSMIRAR